MDPSLYRAAQEGDLNALREKIDTTQLTPNKNTLLHVVAQFNNSDDCAQQILKTNGSLLFEVNSDGETALHVAARNGKLDVGAAMMEFARTIDGDVEAGGEALKNLLTWRNRNGDTALHEAIRNDQPEMVLSLIQTDPEIANIENNAQESPLFLAVKSSPVHGKRILSVNFILQNCPSPAYTGPQGRTALHAVAQYNWKGIAEELLKKHPTLVTKVDDLGWSALHYAALRGSDNVAKELLNADKSIAYIVAEKDNNKTALQIATWKGNVKIMEEILKYCPDSWEMVTSDGRNILHLSVAFKQQEAFKFIMKKPWVGNLVNQTDAKGNTPLHVYAANPNFHHARDLVNHPQAEMNSVNKENKTPLDVITFSDVFSIRQNAVQKELKEKGGIFGIWKAVTPENSSKLPLENKRVVPTDYRKIANTHMLVAALIATVAFAAVFTIPGGYDGNAGPNQGFAILSRKLAFKAFIIADALAMVCSAAAIFIHFTGASFTDKLKLARSCQAARILVVVAMEAMVSAFTFGLLTVLEHSKGLAITEYVICISIFPVFFVFLYSVKRPF